MDDMKPVKKITAATAMFATAPGVDNNNAKKLHLLFWALDRYKVRYTARSFTKDDYTVKHGYPVSNTVYLLTTGDSGVASYWDEHVKVDDGKITVVKNPDDDCLSLVEKKWIGSVTSYFATYSAYNMELLADMYPEVIAAKRGDGVIDQRLFFDDPGDISDDFFALDADHLEASLWEYDEYSAMSATYGIDFHRA